MILDGKKIAMSIYDEIQADLQPLAEAPKLGVILVGEDPASLKYIEQKRKVAESLGIDFELFQFEEFIIEEHLIDKIEELNKDDTISGYLIQLPLPKHLSKKNILRAIDHKKDVDGFHPINQGKLLLGDSDGFTACTPAGIMEMLHQEKILLKGKHVVVIGRSNIVGKPLSLLLINAGATVTSCNSKTKKLSQFTQKADIVISATGSTGLIGKKDIGDNTIVIDVGCNYIDGKMQGDCIFDEIHENGNLITPVPGGVGPMTVAMLMKNTLKAFQHED